VGRWQPVIALPLPPCPLACPSCLQSQASQPSRPRAPAPVHATPQMKPANECGQMSRYVSKLLVVPYNAQAALYSRKININVFRLQFVLGFNWRTRSPSLDYQ